jgi:hypothetical protein
MSQTPAGWYVDAQGVTRWWDGTQWTEHTQPAAPPPQPTGAVPGAGQPAPPSGAPPGAPPGAPGAPGAPGDQYAAWAGQPGAPKSGGVKPWMLVVAGVVVIGVIVAVVLGVVLGGTDAGSSASDAPRNASVADFCGSFNPTRLDPAMTRDDLERLQARMRAVGTPSDMPEDARKGWESLVDVSNASEAQSMDQAELSALGRYYVATCLRP